MTNQLANFLLIKCTFSIIILTLCIAGRAGAAHSEEEDIYIYGQPSGYNYLTKAKVDDEGILKIEFTRGFHGNPWIDGIFILENDNINESIIDIQSIQRTSGSYFLQRKNNEKGRILFSIMNKKKNRFKKSDKSILDYKADLEVEYLDNHQSMKKSLPVDVQYEAYTLNYDLLLLTKFDKNQLINSQTMIGILFNSTLYIAKLESAN